MARWVSPIYRDTIPPWSVRLRRIVWNFRARECLWRGLRPGLFKGHARSISQCSFAAQSVGVRRCRWGTADRERDGPAAGHGMWVSTKALGKLQRRYFDAESGQAGYFGTLEEESGTAVVTVRVKIDDRKISEAEWIPGAERRSGDRNRGGRAGQCLVSRPGVFDRPSAGRARGSEERATFACRHDRDHEQLLRRADGA